MKIILKLFLLNLLVMLAIPTFSQSEDKNAPKIKWLTFTQAVEANNKEPRKFFIDVYTKWCGWCKVMDAKSFAHPVIVEYVNKKYYAVKLDAEMSDTVLFRGYTFVNPNPGVNRSAHQLAAALLNNQFGYPTTVYLDEKVDMLTGSPIPGFQPPKSLEIILKFYGENHYQKTSFEEFKKTFVGEVKE